MPKGLNSGTYRHCRGDKVDRHRGFWADGPLTDGNTSPDVMQTTHLKILVMDAGMSQIDIIRQIASAPVPYHSFSTLRTNKDYSNRWCGIS
jgi:hypothetical protein